MTFPTSASLGEAWMNAKMVAKAIKARADIMRASASIMRMEVLVYLDTLADSLAALSAYASMPGMLAYAQQQQNNPALDLAAEWVAMKTQIEATQTWITGNFPHDSNGYAAVYSFDVNKRFVEVPLTAPQLSAFKSQLALLSATIE